MSITIHTGTTGPSTGAVRLIAGMSYLHLHLRLHPHPPSPSHPPFCLVYNNLFCLLSNPTTMPQSLYPIHIDALPSATVEFSSSEDVRVPYIEMKDGRVSGVTSIARLLVRTFGGKNSARLLGDTPTYAALIEEWIIKAERDTSLGCNVAPRAMMVTLNEHLQLRSFIGAPCVTIADYIVFAYVHATVVSHFQLLFALSRFVLSF
jgi:hypothetical protein